MHLVDPAGVEPASVACFAASSNKSGLIYICPVRCGVRLGDLSTTRCYGQREPICNPFCCQVGQAPDDALQLVQLDKAHGEVSATTNTAWLQLAPLALSSVEAKRSPTEPRRPWLVEVLPREVFASAHA